MNFSDIPFRKNGDDFDASWVNTIVQALKDFFSSYTTDMAAKADQEDVDAAIDDINSNLTAHEADTSTHGVDGDIVGTSDEQTLSNKEFSDPITFDQIATPANPAAGKNKLYPKSDNTFYILDSAGNEVPVGSGSGGGVKNYFTDPKFDKKTTSAIVYNAYLKRTLGDATIGSGEIRLFGEESGFALGDLITYDAGGETALTGLIDGSQYYINSIATSNLINYYGLATQFTGNTDDNIDLDFPSDYTSDTHSFTRTYSSEQDAAEDTHLSVTVNKTDPQAGDGSLEIDYTYDGNSAVGEGVNISTNKIDVQDQGKAIYTYLYFNFKDANYTSGDMKFKLWDKTNSKEIDLEGLGIDTKIYNDARSYNFVFVPPSSTREYYFSLHMVDDNATASWKGKCGTFTMTPQGSVPADIVTVDYIELRGDNGFGSTNTGVARFDTAVKDTENGVLKYEDSATDGATFTALEACEIHFNSSLVTNSNGGTFYITRNATTLTSADLASDSSVISISSGTIHDSLSASVFAEKGDIFRVQRSNSNVTGADHITVTAIMRTQVTLGTNELAMTPVKASYYSTTSTVYSANASLNYGTKTIDNADRVTTGTDWKFTSAKEADYLLTINGLDSSAIVSLYASINGNTTPTPVVYLATIPVAHYDVSAAKLVHLDAGDTLAIKFDGTTSKTIKPGEISIIEVPNFSKFSTYDRLVAGDVYNTTFSVTTSSLASNIPLTAETDTDGIVGTDSITIDDPGIYEFIPYFEMNSGSSTYTIIGQIWVNGSNKRSINQAANNTHSGVRAYLAKLNHGDIVTFHVKTDGGGPYTLSFSSTFKKLSGGY